MVGFLSRLLYFCRPLVRDDCLAAHNVTPPQVRVSGTRTPSDRSAQRDWRAHNVPSTGVSSGQEALPWSFTINHEYPGQGLLVQLTRPVDIGTTSASQSDAPRTPRRGVHVRFCHRCCDRPAVHRCPSLRHREPLPRREGMQCRSPDPTEESHVHDQPRHDDRHSGSDSPRDLTVERLRVRSSRFDSVNPSRTAHRNPTPSRRRTAGLRSTRSTGYDLSNAAAASAASLCWPGIT